MKKKFLMALFFTGILVWAPAENMVPARADNLVDETVSGDGWVTEGNARYYYTDGKKATGFTKISGKTYFFDTKTGAQQTGFVVYRNRIDTNDVARRANEKAEGLSLIHI